MLQLERGTHMAKVDIRNAYRNVPVHPVDRWLLGMSWRRGIFIDAVLPFGLGSAPKIFNSVADALEWIVGNVGVKKVFITLMISWYWVLQVQRSVPMVSPHCQA